jgi:hypothetical protein
MACAATSSKGDPCLDPPTMSCTRSGVTLFGVPWPATVTFWRNQLRTKSNSSHLEDFGAWPIKSTSAGGGGLSMVA